MRGAALTLAQAQVQPGRRLARQSPISRVADAPGPPGNVRGGHARTRLATLRTSRHFGSALATRAGAALVVGRQSGEWTGQSADRLGARPVHGGGRISNWPFNG